MIHRAHWSPEADFSSTSFFIRRMDTTGYIKPSESPQARIPLIGFIYVASGEVLVEVEGTSFLCLPGHILLIPQHNPFAIRYYRDAVGYTGGFIPSILPDTRPLRYLSRPLHQGFWFDEGAFMGELFNMLANSYEREDRGFVEKGLDLLLSRIKPPRKRLSRLRSANSWSLCSTRSGCRGQSLPMPQKSALARIISAGW